MLLPHLRGKIPLGTVVNNTALSANHVKATFGFAEASTDAESLLASEPGPDGGAVLIATRHHLHAPFILAALARGREVFVEKPLCLTADELGRIDEAMAAGRGSIQVGFNRRFAPASAALRRLLDSAPGPKTASFRVMAGRLDPGHWYAQHAESGGRVIGEACHFLDYLCFLFDAPPVRVTAQTVWPTEGRLPFPDSVTAQIEFADGSCGQLVYTAEGDPTWPKELCTVFGAGFVAEVENFQELRTHRGRKSSRRAFDGKGHAEQMAAWVAYLRGEAPHPLPYAVSRRSMQLTFATLTALHARESIPVPA